MEQAEVTRSGIAQKSTVSIDSEFIRVIGLENTAKHWETPLSSIERITCQAQEHEEVACMIKVRNLGVLMLRVVRLVYSASLYFSTPRQM